ncbi:hypothetical protein FEDK69T_06090 [Flavobacterium enshiense DK69]|nr:hypothetical protein FEDK69T_06090 [Flavobacterium enshiense DK69]
MVAVKLFIEEGKMMAKVLFFICFVGVKGKKNFDLLVFVIHLRH